MQERKEFAELIREVIKAEVPVIVQVALQSYPTRDEVQAMVEKAYDRLAASTLAALDDIRHRLDAIESRLGKLEDRAGLISRRLDNIDTAIGEQRSTTYQIRTEAALLRERLAELEERVAKLEAAQHG